MVKCMRKIFCLFIATLLLAMVGCTEKISTNVEKQIETFGSDLALNAHEYSYILNKEITTVCGILASQMIIVHNVIINDTSFDRAETSIKGARTTVETSLFVIESTRPAISYEDDREEVIDSMNNILNIFDDYEVLLKQENIEAITDIAARLKTEFNVLTSYQNVYYN